MSQVSRKVVSKKPGAVQKLLKAILLGTFLLALFHIPTGEETRLVFILAIMIILICLIAVILLTTQRLPGLIWFWAIFALLILLNIIIAWINGLDLIVWLKYTLPITAWPASAIITYSIIDSREGAYSMYRWVILILTVPIIIFYLVMIVNIMQLFSLGSIDIFRGLTIWSEGIGHFGVLLILLTLPFVKKHYALIIMLFGAVALAISSVRSLWIAVVITFFLMLVVIYRARSTSAPNKYLNNIGRHLFIRAIVTSCIVIASLYFLTPVGGPIVKRAGDLLRDRVVGDISLRDRVEEGQAIIENLKMAPVVVFPGAGAGAYYHYKPTRYSYSKDQGAYCNYSHNYYLHLLWNYGIIVLVIFLIGLVQVLRRSYVLLIRNDQLIQEIALGITITIIATAIAANVSSFYNYLRWYLLFGILTGIVCFLSEVEMPYGNSKRTEMVKSPKLGYKHLSTKARQYGKSTNLNTR